MLEIRNLSVSIGQKPILQNITLALPKGQVMVLFGPNGSGKSTLIKTIMGFEGYTVTAGDILFKGQEIQGLPTTERVRKGIGIMFQHPPKIRGVKLQQIAKFLSKDEQKIARNSQRLSLQEHMGRDVNMNFSGGEMKRSELFQLLLQDQIGRAHV